MALTCGMCEARVDGVERERRKLYSSVDQAVREVDFDEELGSLEGNPMRGPKILVSSLWG